MHLESTVVFGSLAIAVALVVIRAVTIPRLKLTKPMGPATWDFSKSWASTFTVLAAAFGTLISATKGIVPDPPRFLSELGTYVTLNLAFGLLIVLAPFLYRATSAHVEAAGGELQLEGYVWSFLVCTLLSAWAALGQLVTVFLMFAETQPTHIATETIAALETPFIITAIAVIVYVFQAIKWTIDAQPKTLTDKVRPRAWDLP